MNVNGLLELIADVDEAVSLSSLPKVYTSCGILTERLKKLDEDRVPADCAAKYFKAANLVDVWAKDVRGANLSAWPAASEILRKVVSMMKDYDDGCVPSEKIVNFWSDKKYEIVNNNMGSGAFGRAVLVRDADADILQVAKVYDPVGMEAESRIRFYRFFKSEIKILHILNHRNIVRIFAAHLYESRQSGIILMEYVAGKTLDKYIAEYDPERDDINAVFYQLIDAFAYLESMRVLHRDIRPSNIMIDSSGVVKVIDFGLGKCMKHTKSVENSTASVVNRGSVRELPEEEYDSEYDSLSDMYYIGELIKRLVQGSKCADVFHYGDVVTRMSNYSRRARYKSFADVLEKIDVAKPWQSVTDDDRDVYLSFVNPIVNGVTSRSSESELTITGESILSGLKKVIEDNSFEYTLGNISILASVFIQGAYRYDGGASISLDAVKAFYAWFGGADENKREMILSSLRARFGQIHVNSPVDEMPF